MKKIGFALVIAGVILSAVSAFALTPPWTSEQLQEVSDLIVEGEVDKPIQCVGQVEQNKCFDKLKFKVSMKVQKVLKGKLRQGETIPVTFYFYDYEKSNCVGDQAAILHSGDQGIYYLKKFEDGTFQPVHWSGAQVKVHGTGSLPKCP